MSCTSFGAARRSKSSCSATRPSSTEGLWNTGLYLTDTWRVSDKLTLNLGVRFDRYKNFLSEQTHEADRFFPETVVFPAVDNVRNWNVAAPRLGVSYNVTGDGRTVIKANWGLYWHNPGTALVEPERLLAEASCLGRHEQRPCLAAG